MSTKNKPEVVAFTAPASLDEGIARLGVIGRLVMSKGWERAGILATIVRLPGKPGPRPGDNRDSGYLTCEQLVKRAIPGLRDDTVIRKYVQRWLDAHDGRHPEWGEPLVTPLIDWPPVDPADAGSRLSADPDKAVEQLVAKHGADATAEAVARVKPLAGKVFDKERDRRVGEMHDKDRLPGGGNIPDEVRDRQDDWERSNIGTATREAELTEIAAYIGTRLDRAAVLIGKGDLSTDERELADEIVDACTRFITSTMEVR